VLDGNLVVDYEDAAYVLGLVYTRGARAGRPEPRHIATLVTSGQLPVVDERAPSSYRRIATSALRAYLTGDRRTIRRAG
jgi:hypothetical protein